MALTKLDVLSAFAELPVCTRTSCATAHGPTSSRRTRATSTPRGRCTRRWRAGAPTGRRRAPGRGAALRRVRRARARRRGLVGRDRRRARARARPLATSMARFFLPAVSALFPPAHGLWGPLLRRSLRRSRDPRLPPGSSRIRRNAAGQWWDGAHANRLVRVRHLSVSEGTVRPEVRPRRGQGNRADRPLLLRRACGRDAQPAANAGPVLLSRGNDSPSGVSGADRRPGQGNRQAAQGAASLATAMPGKVGQVNELAQSANNFAKQIENWQGVDVNVARGCGTGSRCRAARAPAASSQDACAVRAACAGARRRRDGANNSIAGSTRARAVRGEPVLPQSSSRT